MDRMSSVTAMSAVVAGVTWCVAALVHNQQPQGCVGQGCAGTVMRGSTGLTTVLLAVAGAALAVSLVGLLRLARRRVPGGRLARVAATAAGLGLLCLLAAGAILTFGDSNWSGMPWVVAPGVLLLVLGLLLAGVIVWRAGILPRAVTGAVLVTVLLLPFANEQTSLVLLAIPFGVAWATAGAVLLRRTGTDRPTDGVVSPGHG